MQNPSFVLYVIFEIHADRTWLNNFASAKPTTGFNEAIFSYTSLSSQIFSSISNKFQ